MTHPDIVILNGRCITFAQPEITALAVKDGKIASLGSDAEINPLAGPDTKIIDARGQTVMPGFIDSHVHIFLGSAELSNLNLRGLKGRDNLAKAIADYATANPGDGMIVANAALYDILGPGEETTRQKLDAILSGRPLLLMAQDLHTGWTNTIALEMAGILHGARLPEGNEIVMGPDGSATGMLKEFAAIAPVMRLSALGGRDQLGLDTGRDPSPNATSAQRAHDKQVLLQGLHHCARQGITTLHNMDGNFYQLELLQELDDEGLLPLRIEIPMLLTNSDPIERIEEALEMRRRFNSEMVWSNRVKMFMDGVLESYTALMLRPYPGKPESQGEAIFSAEHFNRACIYADKQGLQISVHAVGDGAVRRVLDGFEAAQKANGRRDSRHRIEHIEVISPQDLPRFAELGVVASMQPPHAPNGGHFSPDPGVGDILYPDQLSHHFQWRGMKETGAHLVFSTDWPVIPIDVMRVIRTAVSAGPIWTESPDPRLPLMEVLAAYTRDNAWVEFGEDKKGQLAPGYLADIAILSGDIEATHTEDIERLSAAVTICNGKVTWTDGTLA
jgi:predicted amidohydrolase YtcJ